MGSGLLAAAPLGIAASAPRSRRRTRRAPVHVAATSASGEDGLERVENCSGCLRPESCPCPKAIRRAKQKQQQRRRETSRRDEDDAAPGRRAVLSALGAVAMGGGGAVVPGNPAVAMENGLISEAWSAISGAPSDLTFPEDFLGTWLCYSTLTRVDNLQGDELVQDIAVVNRARKDVGQQIVYPMRFIKRPGTGGDGQGLQRRQDGGGHRARVQRHRLGGVGRQRPERAEREDRRGRQERVLSGEPTERGVPAPDRIETSEVAQIVFDGGDNGGYAPTPTDDAVPAAIPAMALGPDGTRDPSGAAKATKVKSSRTFTKWKFRSGGCRDGPAIVAGQTVYDYLTSFDPGFIESRGQPVTQYTYKLALFRANKYNLEN